MSIENSKILKNKANNKKLISFAVISIVIALIYLAVGSFKETLWLDEIYSYSLANNDAFTIIEESVNAYAGNEIVRDYMTVEQGHSFDFKMVFENQAKDVHPPLYYMFVHFLSSFAPGTFSRLYALVPNIIFAIIVYWQMAWMFNRFCANKMLSAIFAGLYIFTMCFVNNVMLFRMYVLFTVMTNFLAILLIKYRPLDKRTKQFYICLFFIILGGMLTQYYFSIIAAFLCLVYAVSLIYHKCLKDLCLFVATGLIGVCASVIIFPAILHHIFGGYRGVEAFESFSKSSVANVKVLFGILNRQQFGGLFAVVLVVTAIMWFIYSRSNSEVNHKIIYVIFQIALPVTAYLCIISKVAPYLTDRYIMNITGLLYISVFGILYLSAEAVGKKGIIISILVMMLVLIGSYKDGIPYLNRYSYEQRIAIAENKDVPCVFVFGTSWYNAIPYYMELAEYNNIFIIAEYHSDYFEWWQHLNSDKVIVYLDTVDRNKDVLERIAKNSPNIDGYTKLYTSGDIPVYLLD